MASRQVPFGAIERMAWWLVSGQIEESQIADLGAAISTLIGMTLHGKPKITQYPTSHGKGGQGLQAYFEWVESWMIIGTWPELGLVRVAMSTCAIERFLPMMVSSYLKATLGPIRSFGYTEW